ncbi:hypothetical protein BKA70DRAFT_1466652 [Coprinopsis sp. MPI-PUGE-AT-0042]|nr:hypothetical protein BKA70DRAFT_1466652 [Coprinopsis sp. MPI-PUGE-AT-0042]
MSEPKKSGRDEGAKAPSDSSSSGPTMSTNNDYDDHDVGPASKPQGSRPRTLSSDHGDAEQSHSKRPRFSLGDTLRQTSAPAKEDVEEDGPTTSKFFLGESWDQKKTDKGSGGRKFQTQGGFNDDSFAARKDRLKNIAATTLEAIDNGSELEKWNSAGDSSMDVDNSTAAKPSSPALRRGRTNTQITLMQLTTLEGSRWMHAIASSAAPSQGTPPRIGVLNFASAKKPGGGFINGRVHARSSTLYASLMIPTGQKFYKLHHADARGGFYTHAMIYSPGVQLIQDDAGMAGPLEVDMITSPAVNAGDVRNKYDRKRWRKDEDEAGDAWKQDKSGKWAKNKAKKASKPKATEDDSDESASELPEAKSKEELEEMIDAEMYERMARVLYLCQIQSIPNLVLGSFGTGVFRNDVKTVADMWMRLLVGDKAPFVGCLREWCLRSWTRRRCSSLGILGDYGIEVTAPRETGESSQEKWKGKGRSLEEASSTDVSMQDMSQETSQETSQDMSQDMSQEWKI